MFRLGGAPVSVSPAALVSSPPRTTPFGDSRLLGHFIGYTDPDTGRSLGPDGWQPGASSGLAPRTRLDLAAIRATVDRDAIGTDRDPVVARDPGVASTMWRWHFLLSVEDPLRRVSLGEGGTPLLPAQQMSRVAGGAGSGGAGSGRTELTVFVKDEGGNPSGTFKDRGASASVSRLRERGIERVVLPSSGNAGASWALYAARAGLDCHAVLPDDALPSVRSQCERAGARVTVLDGPWAGARALVDRIAADEGRLDVGTLREPFRLEGKRTLGFEIAEGLGWDLPDVLVYPTGGGLGPMAIYAAFEELRELGWIAPERPLPRLVVTQYEGCAPIVRAVTGNSDRVAHWDDEIRIPPGGLKAARPPGGDAVLRLVRESGGTAYAVSAEDAIEATRTLASTEGLFAAPESATTWTGLRRAREDGRVRDCDRVVVVSTGHGLKSIANLPVPAFDHRPAP